MAGLVAALILIQGLGIVALHGHPAGMTDHLHQFVSDGDDHMGHAEDLAYSEAGHGEAGDSVTPSPRAGSSVPFLLAVIVTAAMGGIASLLTTRGRWDWAERRQPPQLHLQRVTVLRV